MARFLSDFIGGKRNLPQPDSAGILKIPVEFTFGATVLAIGDLIGLISLPPNVQIVDYDIIAPQLDSNGTPTLAFSIGIENDARTDLARVIETGLIPGRTANGSIVRCTSPLAYGDTPTNTDRVIALKVTAAAATAAYSGKAMLAMLHLKG